MVRAMEEEEETCKSRLGRFKGMFESGGKLIRRSNNEYNGPLSPEDHDRMTSRSNASVPLDDDQSSPQPGIGCALNRTENVKSRANNDGSIASPLARDRKPSGKYRTIYVSCTYFSFMTWGVF